ncbi:MAG: hypothetical protein GY841_18835 [FCB group bacterium]|nr:hypothetical protein [FCB group bacterium]
MMRILAVVLILITMVAPVRGEDKPDLLQTALDSIGLSRQDLGFTPKGYWGRFPADIPYKIKSFDDLFAEPLKLYDYGKSFGGAVRRYCDPARLDSTTDNLYHLLYFLGVEHKTGGFRSYGANLVDPPQTAEPLLSAIDNLYLAAGKKIHYTTFNRKYEGYDLRADLARQLEPLPEEAKIALAGLIENLREAIHWRDLGIRRIPLDTRLKVFRIRDLSETQEDGTIYYPEIDDAAGEIDFESICYAALKVAAAAEKAEKELRTHAAKVPPDYHLDFPTPQGRIVITGTDDNEIDADDCLLILDFGGDDLYTGSAGATSSIDLGISLLLDLGGNDRYISDNGNSPSLGTGILGVGLLYDAAGSDRYQGTLFSQGAGFLGIGVLFDKDGSDSYRAQNSAQGVGYFGIGLAIDCAGNDNYYLFGDGQGCGSVGGGIGCLADYSGNDIYTAEPSAAIGGHADYHSEHKIAGNYAQGAGYGRRGDGSDGHSWAGGVGAIIDIHGDDQYISGNWSLGVGYWFGTGICYDGDGNDEYQSVYFTQASGAHFCNAILIDEDGDDKHILTETAGAAFGFGWDYTNALFIDRRGNDEYEAKIISYGLAQIRSFAFFFDMAGADSYTYGQGQQGFGGATFRTDFARPTELFNYTYYSKSAGIFIDASGTDNYLLQAEGKIEPSNNQRDNAVWFSPDRADSNFGYNNFGIGLDAATGHIPELEIFDIE